MCSVYAATQFAKHFAGGRQHRGVAEHRRQAASGGVTSLRHAGNEEVRDGFLADRSVRRKSRSLIAAAQWQLGATAVLRVSSPPTSDRSSPSSNRSSCSWNRKQSREDAERAPWRRLDACTIPSTATNRRR